MENVLLSASPMGATGAAAHLWEQFPHFCARSVGQKVFLKAPAIVEEKIRSTLINDVSRKQIERAVDIAETLGVDQSILPLSRGAVWLMKKPTEILARRFPIPRLVAAADNNVQAGPTRLAKMVTPPFEKRVQLLEFDAHGQLRRLKDVGSEGAHVFLDSLEIYGSLGENLVDQITRAA